METKNDNLNLWKKVEKTNPNYTKKANVAGNKITSIAPQFQIMNATEQFGSYGQTWGFKDIVLDYSLANIPFKKDKTEGTYPNVKVVGKEDAYMGLVVFKATFFYPKGEFPVINSISLFRDNNMSKLDDNFAKKIETDALTKALSKLGFNADIFLGKFDDVRYLEEVKKEFNKAPKKEVKKLVLKDDVYQTALKSTKVNVLEKALTTYELTDVQLKGINDRIVELKNEPKKD